MELKIFLELFVQQYSFLNIDTYYFNLNNKRIYKYNN